jgi:TolB-like protein/DNA-binding winged helix-turn-helix (wHTH) protein
VDHSESQPTYVFEGFRLDTQHRTLFGADGRPVPLPPKTLDTLCHLVARAGQVVRKRDLMEAVWPHVVVEENNLNQAISQLRRALGEKPDDRRFIVTEPGRGYRFVARLDEDTAAREDPPASPVVNEPPPARLGRPRGARRRLAGTWALGLALTAGVVGLAWYLAANRDAPLPNSIAVLPFENLSANPDNAFFAAGLHGEILSQLAKISALNVIGQSSMLRISASGRSLQEIADELNVETVLHATVEYAEGRVRIRPQLVAGTTGQTLWAESYERGFEDIFLIESEIATEIAAALRAEFSVAEQTAVETPPTSSPEAYAAYLRARNVRNTSPALSFEYLDEATRLDPNFALAHAAKAEQLADALITRSSGEAADSSAVDELERRILAAAGEALRLDGNVWLAHFALGNLHEHRWRWTEALRAHEQAARTAPRGVRRVPDFEPFFRDLDFTRNIREQREIVALDPLVAGEHWVLGLQHAYAHDAPAAAAAFRQAVSLDPDDRVAHIWLAHAETMLGRSEEALRELGRAEQVALPHNSVGIANLAYAYARNDRPADARRLFELLSATAGDRRHQAGNWALAHFAVGDIESARAALETVVEKIANQEPDAGYLTLRFIRANPYSDPALEEPAIAALREQLRGR